MARSAILLGALLLVSCNPVPTGNQAAGPTVEAAPAKPFVPLSAAEIRARLPGHYVDEGPYSCIDGPLLILTDGSFDTMYAPGRTGGDYVVADGRITFDDAGAPEHFSLVMLLYRDQKDRLYFKYEGEDGDPRPATLKPADPKIFGTLCADEIRANAA